MAEGQLWGGSLGVTVPPLKLLGSALLKHWLMMEFIAVKLKIIPSLGGLCGDYQRGVEYVQETPCNRD